ncbi:asparagine-linked glycosylation 14 [Hyphodiscus hymeniophilus]|uniref:UDP-N-acetylglucosamine transferase subunit ALG14 n=1 Tax=Hyphodiscus hymeniophilus TaxID=353542 RepID=A0A9P6VQW9_9HELO|nr:asparagine-linked glycosylation 14 [Hyphodiscus hymeniophilus]
MANLSALQVISTGIAIVFVSGCVRLFWLFLSISRPVRDPRIKYPKTGPSHMVVVLGSGGHTAEMMSLLRDVDPTKYIHRTYIISSGDGFSSDRAFDIETKIQSRHNHGNVSSVGEVYPATGKWEVKIVPRARKIHQSRWTTALSSLWCLISCMATLRTSSITSIVSPFDYPDVIIANGPATAVMVVLASFLLKLFGFAPIYKMKTIYVESWARVKTLSLSGKVLLWLRICDKFVVQWEELAKNINQDGTRRKVEWSGFLVE